MLSKYRLCFTVHELNLLILISLLASIPASIVLALSLDVSFYLCIQRWPSLRKKKEGVVLQWFLFNSTKGKKKKKNIFKWQHLFSCRQSSRSYNFLSSLELIFCIFVIVGYSSCKTILWYGCWSKPRCPGSSLPSSLQAWSDILYAVYTRNQCK